METIIDLLRDAERVVVVTHKDPDGDAIGTLLGLGWALRAMDKRVTLACDDGAPWPLDFLPGSADVVSDLAGVEADLAVVVDCSDDERPGRVGRQAAALGVPLVNIDHHVTNTRFGQANLVNPGAAAAAEIVYELLKQMGQPLDVNIATCLLTGLVTDTRCFRTPNVHQGVLRTAVQLMDAGASLAYITQHAMGRQRYRTLVAQGRALGKMRQEDGVIWSAVSQRDWREFDPEGNGVKPRNLSSTLIGVDDARVSAFFSEMPDGRIDISMRAKPGHDLTRLFDAGAVLETRGGGHPLASGATVDGDMDTIVSQVVAALKALVRQQASD